jgi:hypothetical protein
MSILIQMTESYISFFFVFTSQLARDENVPSLLE